MVIFGKNLLHKPKQYKYLPDMKSFLKYTLATITGFLIVNIFIFILFFILFGAALAFSSHTVSVQKNSVLTIRLDTPIDDRASDNPLDNIDLLSISTQPNLGLNKILASIEYASFDDNIRGIYLNINDIQGTFRALATTQEIRNALQKFKESGKFIYSYSNLGYSQLGYYLATVADSIFVNPETPFTLSGISSSVTFYKETLEKLGIQPEIVKVGKFKSAVEPFIATEMSNANREQVKKYLDSSWSNIIKGISTSRNIPTDSINALTDRLNFYTTQQFTTWGYFDKAIYEDQMLAFLKKACGTAPDQKLHQIQLTDYQKVVSSFENQSYNPNKIAIIYAQGEIGLEQTAKSIGPDLTKSIRKARLDKNTKAIVLRVNSPGGSALTSDIIWREVHLAQQEKPVIVSMGDVAASGGYYISCAADTIVAEPTTLTGSIGIFGIFFSGEKLIKDKLGISTDVVKTNKYSDFGGTYPLPIPISSRPLSTYEKNILQNYVNQGYETFLSRVMAGRNLTHDELDAIAQGRVWTGEDAQQIGLVDILGGLEDAIRIAANKAEIDQYMLVEYPTLENPIEQLLYQLTGGIKTQILQKEMGSFYSTWSQLKEVISHQGILARLPFDLITNEFKH